MTKLELCGGAMLVVGGSQHGRVLPYNPSGLQTPDERYEVAHFTVNGQSVYVAYLTNKEFANDCSVRDRIVYCATAVLLLIIAAPLLIGCAKAWWFWLWVAIERTY